VSEGERGEDGPPRSVLSGRDLLDPCPHTNHSGPTSCDVVAHASTTKRSSSARGLVIYEAVPTDNDVDHSVDDFATALYLNRDVVAASKTVEDCLEATWRAGAVDRPRASQYPASNSQATFSPTKRATSYRMSCVKVSVTLDPELLGDVDGFVQATLVGSAAR
jgi:hypothetical protein